MMNRAFLPVRTTRRAFLIGATAIAGGFAVGFRPAGALAQEGMPASQADAAPVNPFAAYVTITNDDRITVISSQFDMGEGSYHGIATLVLEELGGRWDQTDVVGGVGDPKLYGNLAVGGALQFTGGSTSMTSSWDRYRQAGATARAMLVAAAAEQWGVDAGEITVADGKVTHPTAGSLGFGALAEACGGDAGAGRGAAEGAGAVDADRQRRRPPLRRPVEDQRDPPLHPRPEAARDADRGHDPSAEVRREGARPSTRRRRRRCRASSTWCRRRAGSRWSGSTCGRR